MKGTSRVNGFTLVEVLVTLVFLTVVGVAFSSASHHATKILQRSRLELNASRFLENQVARLRLLTYESLVDGTRTDGRGIANWTVADSAAFKEIMLETRYGSPARGLVVDSVTIYRVRP